VRLTKHHGLGNDFLIVLDEANDGPVTVGPDDARRLCNRRTGIGADGLIHGRGDEAVRMTLYNSDGSRAEISGNGVRCLGQAVALARALPQLEIDVVSDAGTHRVAVEAGPTGDTAVVTAEMGAVVVFADGELIGAEEALRAELSVGRIGRGSIGNPHIVAEVADPGAIDLADIGPRIELAVADGVNVELIRAASEPDTIEMAVWERGAGITRACGSGACVAASFAHDWGLAGPDVQVSMPGGVAEVLLGEPVRLRGPVVWVATVVVPE